MASAEPVVEVGPSGVVLGDVRLYELTGALADLYLELEENGGELTPELEKVLDQVEGDFRAKVDRVMRMERQKVASAKTRKAMLDAYEEETKRLRALVKADEASAAGLRQYVIRQLKALGMPKLETERFRLAVRLATRPTIRWVDARRDPPVRFRKAPELDGTRAWEEYRQSGKLPRGFVVETSEWLDVR